MNRTNQTVWIATLCLALAALACRGPRPGRAPETSCAHVQTVRETRGISLCEDAWTCARPPGGPFDRLGMHRLAPCEAAGGPVVLYLPGMHMTGELPLSDPRYDLRLHLAAAGARAWAVDYRSHSVPADASAAELQRMQAWTTDLWTEDASWAAGFARAVDSGPLFIAGFSQGASLAYRLASRSKTPFAGLIILDGALGSGRNRDEGGVAIDVGGGRLPWAERQRLLAAVLADPDNRSPLAGYRTSGEALADILFTAPSFGGQGGLANTRANVSDVGILATVLASYDRWWPRAALSGDPPSPPERKLPVLAFASTRLGHAWVERVRDSAHAYGGPEATVRELRDYGHLDVLVSRTATRDVYGPIVTWLGRGGR